MAVDFLIAEDARPTTTKTRVIASHQQIVRVDEEDVAAMPGEAEDRAREVIAKCLERTSAVVVSDYAKGFLTPSLLRFVTAAAGRAGKRVFVDPKGADYARYQGCFLMKPNRLELSILTGLPARNHEETLAAGSRLSSAHARHPDPGHRGRRRHDPVCRLRSRSSTLPPRRGRFTTSPARETPCWPLCRWRFPPVHPIATPWSWPPKPLPLPSAPWVPRP